MSSHLKYAFLSEYNTLLVIIFANLTKSWEAALLSVLKVHRKAIGYIMINIKGISPFVEQHRIHLLDNA